MKNSISITKDYYEQTAWKENLLICGIDEVGRGCLAGPVVIAAAILPINSPLSFNDSKTLSEKKREAAYEWLIKNAHYSIAFMDHSKIEQHNIYHATLRGMRTACLQLATRYPTYFKNLRSIVVDAMPLTLPADLPHLPEIAFFPKGETYSTSIAAASIIAKVTRDRLMKRISPLFPHYTFAQDKAYASPTHRKTICTQAATFLHRPLFVATTRSNGKGLYE